MTIARLVPGHFAGCIRRTLRNGGGSVVDCLGWTPIDLCRRFDRRTHLSGEGAPFGARGCKARARADLGLHEGIGLAADLEACRASGLRRALRRRRTEIRQPRRHQDRRRQQHAGTHGELWPDVTKSALGRVDRNHRSPAPSVARQSPAPDRSDAMMAILYPIGVCLVSTDVLDRGCGDPSRTALFNRLARPARSMPVRGIRLPVLGYCGRRVSC